MTVLHSINVRRGSPGTASGQNDIEAAATEENCRSTTKWEQCGTGAGGASEKLWKSSSPSIFNKTPTSPGQAGFD